MSVTTKTRPARRKLIPAAAIIAVVALSAGTGSAVAAKMITGADIKNNSVSGKDIKNGSLATKDLNKAAKGKLNKPALPGYEINSATKTIVSSSNDVSYADCSDGKVAIGGGAEWDFYDAQVYLVDSQPAMRIGEFYSQPENDLADSWRAMVRNTGGSDRELTVYVICADPS